jgi:hypothetical protein
VVELKDKDPNPNLDTNSKNDKRRQINDAEPTATVATTTIQPIQDLEEGE